MTAFMNAMSNFGDAAGWLIAAIVFVAYARRIIRENDRAHDALTKRIEANGNAIAALGTALERLRESVHEIATNVAVLRDRSDRPTRAPE